MNISGTYDIKRKVGISVLMGLLSLIFAPYGITSILGEVTIDIPWSLVLPILVAMAYGWQYGAIAGLTGGALFPFLLWANNGWGNLFTSIIFLCIYIISGFLYDTRYIKRIPKLPLRIFLIILPGILMVCYYYIFQFNTALSFNPPFWQQDTIHELPDETLYSFAIKDCINILILVLVAESLLRLPFVCKILGLPTEVKMRENNKIFVTSIITSFFIWFLFAGLNFALLKGDHTFFNEHNTLALLVILSCGIFVARMIFFFSESHIFVQSELNSSEKKYRELFEANKDGITIFHISPDGNLSNFIEMNEAAGAMLGYTKAELSGMKPSDLEVEGTDEQLMQRMKDLQTKGFSNFETLLKHKNGNIIPVEINVILINTSNPPVLMNITRDITERKQLETTFRDIIEKNPMSIQLLDIEGYSLGVNSAHTKLFGVKPPANYSFFNDTQLLSLGFNKLFEQIKKGEVVYFPDSYYNVHDVDPSFPDSPVWVKALGFTLNDIEGKPNKIVLMHENITERKKAEALLEDIIENNPMSIQIVDKEGYTLKANPAFIELFGMIPPPEFSIFDDLKSKSTELENLVSRVKQGEIVHLPDVYFNTHDAVAEAPDLPLWIRALIFPLKDSAGKPERFVFMHENITERKLAEQELIKAKEQAEGNEEKFRSLAENSNDYIMRYDPAHRHTYMNKAGISVSGGNAELIIGKTHREAGIYNEAQCAIWEQQINKVFTTKEPHFEQFTFEGATGLIYLDWRLFPEMNDKNEVVSVLGVSRDITYLKRAEIELIEKNAELDHARQRAEESDRLKSAFLANMSHEIRTPMNGILGFAELLKEPDLSGDEQQKYIRIIEKSGMRMLNIINDIVDISKIESGLMKINLVETNINEQVEYLYTFFKPEVQANGVKLSFKTTLSAKEATIITDREKVYAILTNLVKNAIKYTKEGSIHFGYSLKESAQLSGNAASPMHIEFYVKDTGIGIPPDRQDAIFERFVQADIEDKMAMQGAGLGLTITKNYVGMLGGKIWVESQEGIGSVFYFTLPYNTPQVENKINKNTVVDGKTEIQATALKILIAEDDEVSEMLLQSTVKMFGKGIINARTGTEAVELCRQNPDIDLILMDIRMPEMGGYEATRQIRGFNKNVVIIAQTAYGLSGDREKAIEAGCDDYISKPINRTELLALIQKYFKD
jgi:PAS domain S-box-containing protein